jgi:XTP/dITP diphosphohydrolase
MKPVFVATGNKGKLQEIVEIGREFFPAWNTWQGRAPRDAEETAPDFLGNALIKAEALHQELKAEGLQDFFVLADDSGIEVDALNGAPGVISARYAGDHVDPKLHIEKLLGEMRGKSERGAQYHCSLVLIEDCAGAKKTYQGQGICRGTLKEEALGNSGFGYDPIFYVDSYGKTMAELSSAEKNFISHRRNAFKALANIFK